MTVVIQAYRDWLRSQGQTRFTDTVDMFPALVRALAEELPDVIEAEIVRVSGRTVSTYCLFRLSESPYWYTVLVRDWVDDDEHEKRVSVAAVKPWKENLMILGSHLVEDEVVVQTTVHHFSELRTLDVVAPRPKDKTQGWVSSCVIV